MDSTLARSSPTTPKLRMPAAAAMMYTTDMGNMLKFSLRMPSPSDVACTKASEIPFTLRNRMYLSLIHISEPTRLALI
eukprot:10322283-Alexandrium_andersonii.AAC.1